MIFHVMTSKGSYVVDTKSEKKAREIVLKRLQKEYFKVTKKDIYEVCSK